MIIETNSEKETFELGKKIGENANGTRPISII